MTARTADDGTARGGAGGLRVDRLTDSGVVVLRDQDGVTTALVFIDPRDPTAALALARKMAAAPQMFEALQKIANSEPGGHLDGQWYRLDPKQDIRELKAIARAAISAALTPATDGGGG